MEKVSLSNIDSFKIIDRDAGDVFYGCNQDWFGTAWQRLSGCGPSVVTSVILYRNSDGRAADKADAVSLMEEVWKFVTPTERGIPTSGMLLERVEAYAASKGFRVGYGILDVPEGASPRPSSDELALWLSGALGRDEPVAFLNLCNGEERSLDEWHWVIIVSVERREPDGHVIVGIIDRGAVATADLSVWLETTTCGGGFVHFEMT
jgi:hypothetical protein